MKTFTKSNTEKATLLYDMFHSCGVCPLLPGQSPESFVTKLDAHIPTEDVRALNVSQEMFVLECIFKKEVEKLIKNPKAYQESFDKYVEQMKLKLKPVSLEELKKPLTK